MSHHACVIRVGNGMFWMFLEQNGWIEITLWLQISQEEQTKPSNNCIVLLLNNKSALSNRSLNWFLFRFRNIPFSTLDMSLTCHVSSWYLRNIAEMELTWTFLSGYFSMDLPPQFLYSKKFISTIMNRWKHWLEIWHEMVT